MDEETFVRTWALAQISPGINLLKLTVLVGYYLRGWPGLLAGMAGLLIPSASATILMTAGFAMVRQQPLVQAALRGILPATIGLSLAMAVQMGQPLLARAHREGPRRLGLQIGVMVLAGLLLALWNVSPLVILMASGGVTILFHMWVPAAGVLPAAEVLPAVEIQPAAKDLPAKDGGPAALVGPLTGDVGIVGAPDHSTSETLAEDGALADGPEGEQP
jgi:chromate transporter